jgi:hypothetical protein
MPSPTRPRPHSTATPAAAAPAISSPLASDSSGAAAADASAKVLRAAAALQALRISASDTARAYLDGQLSWDAAISAFSDADDPLIVELFELIEHEPLRGGVLGISSEAFAAYHQQVLHLIQRLRDAPDSPGAA